MAQDQRRAWLVVASLFIALFLVLGATASTLSFYFASFVKLFGWSRTQVSLISTVFSLAMGLSAPAAGWLLDMFDAGLVMASGQVLVVVGLLMASRAGSLNPVLTAYVLIGVGVGAATMVPASVVATNWFKTRRGLALGSTMAGAAAASVVTPLIVSHLLLTYGPRTTLLISAIPILVVVIPLMLLVVRTHPQGSEEAAGTSAEHTAGKQGLDFGQALRTTPFWMLVIVQVFYGAGFGGLHYHFVPMILNAGYSQSTAAILMSSAASIALVSFFVIGVGADRYGGRAALTWSMIALGVGVALFAGIGYRTVGVPILLVSLVLIGLAAGASPIAAPVLLVETLGLRRFGSLWGLLNFCGLIGFAIGPVLVGRSFDRTGNYVLAMEICGAICVAGGLAAAAAFPAAGHDLVPQAVATGVALKPSEARAPL
jgi:MFS family permease